MDVLITLLVENIEEEDRHPADWDWTEIVKFPVELIDYTDCGNVSPTGARTIQRIIPLAHRDVKFNI